jgi:hypothetical protein
MGCAASQPKAILNRSEQKSLQTDRVVLRPGPPKEVEVARRLYRMFVVQRRAEREIAAILNAEGIRTDLGRPWTRGTVHQVLTNEKYIGNNVYNRASSKLQMKRVVNPPGMWVRHNAAFEPLVEQYFFEAHSVAPQASKGRRRGPWRSPFASDHSPQPTERLRPQIPSRTVAAACP